MNPLASFKTIFGGTGNTDTPTYESLKRKREIADMLAQDAMSGEYNNWGDGVGGLMKALGARLMENKIGPQEDAERSRISELLGGYGGGSTGPVAGAPGGFTGAGYSGNPASMPMAQQPAGGGASMIRQELLERGLPEHVADGFVMNFQDESGLNPDINEQNPTVPGSRGGYGLAQWTGPRREGLESFAQQSGRPVSDTDLQLDYLMQELQGPESAAAQKIMATQDPGQAGAAIAQHFLRPAQQHLDQRVAEYTGGQGLQGLTDAMGMGGGPDMARLSELADVLGNPYASEGQRVVAQALIENMLEGGGGIDPMDAARLGLDQQKFELEKQKFNREGTRDTLQTYGSAQWAMRDDPTTPENDPAMAPYVIDKAGGVKWLDLGGAQPLPPTENVNLGTSIQPIAAGATPIGEPLAVDNAGKAAATKVGENVGAVTAGLPDFSLAVKNATDLIDSISGADTLEGVTGMIQGRMPAMTQAGTDTVANIDELTNKVFPIAIEALKGLGAMSEMEGKAAVASLTNLDRKKGTPAFKEELQQFKQLLADKLAIAQAKAGQKPAVAGIPQSAVDAGIDPDLWQFMSPEDQALWSN